MFIIQSVNFYAPVELTRAILPRMINHRKGSIAVISSVQGKLGLPFRSSYSASKHAIQCYFDGLRAEISDFVINVTIISPGYVATSLSLNALNSDGTAYGKTDMTTANGMLPSEVAYKVLSSIATGKPDVILADFKVMTAIQIKALFPEFMALLMKRRARSSKN